MENNLKNSEDYLRKILQKDTGFSTPKKYFSKVEETLSSIIFEEKLPKKNGLQTPENYFNNLEDTILDKVITKKVKVVSLKNRLLKYIPIATAASIALFLSINFINGSNSKSINFDNLAQVDIENWIIDNATELTTEDFETILNTESINEEDFAFTDLKNDAIEDYIIDTDHTFLLNEDY